MPTEAPVELFHREVSDHITVAVDGVYGDLSPYERVQDPRRVGRVIVTMPDYVADTLSHLIATAHEIASRLCGEVLDVGSVDLDGPDLDLSVALHEASRLHGYELCRKAALHEAAAAGAAADDMARLRLPDVDRPPDARALNLNGRDLLR
jgi:hypothetical protein